RRRHTRLQGDWSSDVCSSDLLVLGGVLLYFGFKVLGGAALLVLAGADSSAVRYCRILLLGKGLQEECEHAVAGDVGEGDQFKGRSEERRVGKECRAVWCVYH